jgi:serine/threonine protein kinase
VTGKVPFPGGTTSEKAKRHLEDMPLHPRRLNPNISDEFVDVIADMMHKDPTQRIQSADEVVVRLAPWAEDRVSAPLIEGLEDRLPPVAELSPFYEPDKSEEFAARPSTLFGGEDASGSHSQISQVTLPIDLAHETLPLENTELWLPPKPKWTRETFIIGGAALIAILTLLWVVIGALTK